MKNQVKKICLIVLVSFVAFILLSGLVLLGVYFLSPKSTPQYVAHRGSSQNHLGNTEAAFLAATELPFYGIETDIRKTKDGVFVCNHDETVKYADGDEKSVSESSYADLIAKPLKNEKSDETAFLCTFERYLEICKNGGKVAVIELKEDFSEEDVLAILDAVDAVYDKSAVSVISFYFDALLRVRASDASLGLQYLSETKNDPLFERCLEEKISIDVRQSILTKKMVKTFHKAGLTVNAWTVNKAFDRNTVRIKGVDYITTDFYTRP
ncbi:MAG: hypothetical protein J6Y74_02440 [Clostridia bacterium]|nr:hypothetical protein [Clostridia bacterium]